MPNLGSQIRFWFMMSEFFADLVLLHRLGVGATAPTSGDSNIFKRKDPSLDALRKQLLGRHAPRSGSVPSKSLPIGLTKGTSKPIMDDSDSDEGRAAAFTSKTARGKEKNRNAPEAHKSEDTTQEDDGDESKELSTTAAPVTEASPPSKRKATSYLDEILAEKSAKKKKKKQRVLERIRFDNE